MASIAVGNAGSAYDGVAPGAALVAVKIMDHAEFISSTYIEDGLRWILDYGIPYTGIDVLFLEIDTNGYVSAQNPNPMCWQSTDNSMSNILIRQIMDRGVSVVTPVGNSANTNDKARTCNFNQYAAPNGVIAVGASVDPTSRVLTSTDPAGWSMTQFSGRGPTADGVMKPSITAPGIDIMAAQKGTTDGYTQHAGTSPATPIVAGIVAGLLDAGESNPANILNDIQTTGKRIGGYNSILGGGYIQPLEAYKKVILSSSTWDLTRSIATFPLWCGVVGESMRLSFTVTTPSVPVVLAPVSYNYTYYSVNGVQGGFGAMYNYEIIDSSNNTIWHTEDTANAEAPLPAQSLKVGTLAAGAYTAKITPVSFLGTLPTQGICAFFSVSYK
jgi:serine protease AprX